MLGVRVISLRDHPARTFIHPMRRGKAGDGDNVGRGAAGAGIASARRSVGATAAPLRHPRATMIAYVTWAVILRRCTQRAPADGTMHPARRRDADPPMVVRKYAHKMIEGDGPRPIARPVCLGCSLAAAASCDGAHVAAGDPLRCPRMPAPR